MLSLVRSITGNFTLYKESIQSLLPRFLALDHINYARWLSVHLMDMLYLHQTNICVAECFENGAFVVQKAKNPFSPTGIDHAHEQNKTVLKGMEVGSVSASKFFELKYDDF